MVFGSDSKAWGSGTVSHFLRKPEHWGHKETLMSHSNFHSIDMLLLFYFAQYWCSGIKESPCSLKSTWQWEAKSTCFFQFYFGQYRHLSVQESPCSLKETFRFHDEHKALSFNMINRNTACRHQHFCSNWMYQLNGFNPFSKLLSEDLQIKSRLFI